MYRFGEDKRVVFENGEKCDFVELQQVQYEKKSIQFKLTLSFVVNYCVLLNPLGGTAHVNIIHMAFIVL